jgi:hypothetical protein
MKAPKTEKPRAATREARSENDSNNAVRDTRPLAQNQASAFDVLTRRSALDIPWTDLPRNSYPAMRRFVAHAERLLREEIIAIVTETFTVEELTEARRCSDLFKLFTACHLSGGRPAMANLFIREILKIHRRLEVAITSKNLALDIDQATQACMKGNL